VGTSVTTGSHTIITNGSIEPSYYKSSGQRLQHYRASDGSLSTDSAVGWIPPSPNFPGGWSIQDTSFGATSPFASTAYTWSAQGDGWLDWGIAGAPPPDGLNAPFSLAETDPSAFSLNTSLTVKAQGSEPGASDSNNYQVTWHLP
jgi:hypothetical protein